MFLVTEYAALKEQDFQTFLLLIPMNQESMWLMPPKTQFQKAVGRVKKFFCGHSRRMKVTLNWIMF